MGAGYVLSYFTNLTGFTRVSSVVKSGRLVATDAARREQGWRLCGRGQRALPTRTDRVAAERVLLLDLQFWRLKIRREILRLEAYHRLSASRGVVLVTVLTRVSLSSLQTHWSDFKRAKIGQQ